METNLIMVVVFVCGVCHLTEAQLLTPASLTSSITRTTCGSSKLCVSSVTGCDPAGNSSCFFSSTQLSNGVLTVELTGTTSGFVALQLTATNNQTQQIIQGTSLAFVCGNNNTDVNGSLFFHLATLNSTVLTPANATTVNISSLQGSIGANQSLIQCIFNITLNSNVTQLPYNITILNGTTMATSLGNASSVFTSSGPLDLANPRANIPASPSPVPLNIIRDGCGTTKLCVPRSTCNLTGNSSCFFSSFQLKDQSITIELSGTTTGYVALGLTRQGTTFVAACGNDSNNFFFQPASLNGITLTPVNVSSAIFVSQAVVAVNQPLIQCIFNISTTLNISTRGPETTYSVSILNGTTNGRSLGNATTVVPAGDPLDLINPSANIPGPAPLNLTLNGCGVTKLCFPNATACNPAGNSTCFFGSVRANQNFSFEVSGATSGYVALGLTQQNSTLVFVCGNNTGTNSNSFFFVETTASPNLSSLIPSNTFNAFTNQGTVRTSPALIQCIFNTSTNLTIQSNGSNTLYQVRILTGTTSGTQLGTPTTVYDSVRALNLSDPTALNTSTRLCTNVLAVLLCALILRLL